MGAHARSDVYLLEVVRTVNHVYAAIVKTVMAAKSHPNLYVYTYQQLSKKGRPEGHSERNLPISRKPMKPQAPLERF
jgi:hypothetical protein